MSIKVMTHVWDNSKAKGSELLLLLAIADHAADDGYCWPTIETLAHKIRMTKRSVMRLVQALEKRGDLHVVRSNRNNRYVVIMNKSMEQINVVLETRKDAIGDKLSPDNISRDEDVTPIGDTSVTSTGDKDVTLIINEPSIESSIDGRSHFMALSKLCVVDLNVATNVQKQQLGQSAKKLKKAGVTSEQIDTFGKWWYKENWLGKKGQPPTPAQVRNEWGKFMQSGTLPGTQRIIRIGR